MASATPKGATSKEGDKEKQNECAEGATSRQPVGIVGDTKKSSATRHHEEGKKTSEHMKEGGPHKDSEANTGGGGLEEGGEASGDSTE